MDGGVDRTLEATRSCTLASIDGSWDNPYAVVSIPSPSAITSFTYLIKKKRPNSQVFMAKRWPDSATADMARIASLNERAASRTLLIIRRGTCSSWAIGLTLHIYLTAGKLLLFNAYRADLAVLKSEVWTFLPLLEAAR